MRADARCACISALTATRLPESLCDAHDAQIAAIAARDEALAERLAHEHAEEVHQRFLRYMGERNSSDLSVVYDR
jgi:DNA-binding GntR family transcriptional regulator